MKTKRCSKCKETKPVSGFSKDARRKDGLCSWCKECQRQHDQQYRLNLRSQIIQLYGCQCFGCGNPHYGFLEIDHILGGGAQHRRDCGGDIAMYRAILAEGYRPDKYRVLCKVCNQLARWFSIEEIQAIFKPVQYLDNSQQVYKKE